MITFFLDGFRNTNRNMGFVLLLFLIDTALIALTGLLSLEWVASNIGARIIVLHYNIFRAISASPEIIKLAAEILIISGSIAAADQSLRSGRMKKGTFIRQGLRRYFRILSVTLIWLLAAVVPAFGAILLYAVRFSGSLSPLSAVLMASTVGFLLAMSVMFFFTPFIAVLEDRNALNAVRTGFVTAKAHFRRILAFIGIYLLITLGLYLSAALIIGAYVGAVELVTGSSKLGLLSKFSIEAVFSFAARYVYISGVFATILFYRSVRGGDEKTV